MGLGSGNVGGGRRGGQWFPPEWPERIRALARGELTPVEPRRAATVLLLRDGEAGLEVFLLRRRASMAFAGGAYAYPGGSADPTDESVRHTAARELFEETGVLLAAPAAEPGRLVAAGDDLGRRPPFGELLARRGLVARVDLLGAWARWITPEFEARRYDTWFFVAALPPGQHTRNASTEADRTEWLPPAAAVTRYERGELLMMPPTVATLRQLLPYRTAAAALAAAGARPEPEPVLARARLVGDEVVLSWPGYEEFEKRLPWQPSPGGERSEEERRT
ncbi:NUDIX hydrolase [Streptomyces hainanensis]|uniref:NUDIX domain-containing protein n=1 Tax=Streptomyces hainanensis TaxID=402648 RepID=A0A4R4T2I9_9ACTN|nr:NUDIX domain-containing protein [Streptomyces hainanensis]TDC71000.1 NUDIX domain-containing protein [Streptomyces hainanensis]